MLLEHVHGVDDLQVFCLLDKGLMDDVVLGFLLKYLSLQNLHDALILLDGDFFKVLLGDSILPINKLDDLLLLQFDVVRLEDLLRFLV